MSSKKSALGTGIRFSSRRSTPTVVSTLSVANKNQHITEGDSPVAQNKKTSVEDVYEPSAAAKFTAFAPPSVDSIYTPPSMLYNTSSTLIPDAMTIHEAKQRRKQRAQADDADMILLETGEPVWHSNRTMTIGDMLTESTKDRNVMDVLEVHEDTRPRYT